MTSAGVCVPMQAQKNSGLLMKSDFVSSKAGLVKLLDDPDTTIRKQVLTLLLDCVDKNWHEISDEMLNLEGLVQDESFPYRKEASLLLSKLAYNIGANNEILKYAMIAEDLFDMNEPSEYTLTVITKAVEHYCQERQNMFDTLVYENVSTEQLKRFFSQSSVETANETKLLTLDIADIRVEQLIEKMIFDSLSRGLKGQQEAIGVTIESWRLDLVKQVVNKVEDKEPLLKFCVQLAKNINFKRFRTYFYETMVDLYDSVFPIDRFENVLAHNPEILKILYNSGYADRIAQLLYNLLTYDTSAMETDSEIPELIAYQCAFDLVSYEDSSLIAKLLNHELLQLPEEPEPVENDQVQPKADIAADGGATETSAQNDFNMKDASQPSTLKATDCENEIEAAEPTETDPLIQSTYSAIDSNAQKDGDQPSVDNTADFNDNEDTGPTIPENCLYTKIYRVRHILSGLPTLDLTVEFLNRANRSDLDVLEKFKVFGNTRSFLSPNSFAIAHGLMLTGTTCNSVLRENLEWIGRAVCWSKFLISASIGLLHKGHVGVSRQVLSAYLPGSGGDSYSCGGALFGLGLIHANRPDADTTAYLLQQLQTAQTQFAQNYEPFQYGACLALGLINVGTMDQKVLMILRDILFLDSAVSGEAAALAIGLVGFGSSDEDLVMELLGHAQDTEHERIVRGASLGAALILYRKEEEAEPLLKLLTKHKEPMIRYGGMYAIGLAYCGTSNCFAVRQLLHIGVTDISHDVRRAAVIALGFVFCNSPEQIPELVSIQADSFDLHVRHAAALAVGIGCSGTNLTSADKMLSTMTQDTSDLVRQAALMAIGMVLPVCPSCKIPGNENLGRNRYLSLIPAFVQGEDPLIKMAAITSFGLAQAGGCNSTISFYSSEGSLRPESVIGFFLFSQLWFWHPFMIAVALAFRPSGLIGISKNFQAPEDFGVRCARIQGVGKIGIRINILKGKSEMLSSTLRSTRRLRATDVFQRGSDETGATRKTNKAAKNTSPLPTQSSTSEDAQMEDILVDEFVEIRQKMQQEGFCVKKNLTRILPDQLNNIDFNIEESNWRPADPKRKSGIILLKRIREPAAEDVDMKGDESEQKQ